MIKRITIVFIALIALSSTACGTKTTEVYMSAPVPPRAEAAPEEVEVEWTYEGERKAADPVIPTKLRYNNLSYERVPVLEY